MPTTFSSTFDSTFVMALRSFPFICWILTVCLVFNLNQVVSVRSQNVGGIRAVSHPTLTNEARCRLEKENCFDIAFGNVPSRIKECVKCVHHCIHGLQYVQHLNPLVGQEMQQLANDCGDKQSSLRFAYLVDVKYDCHTIPKQVFLNFQRNVLSIALINCVHCAFECADQKDEIQAMKNTIGLYSSSPSVFPTITVIVTLFRCVLGCRRWAMWDTTRKCTMNTVLERMST